MRDLSLHLLDIMQNSITAKADYITVILAADELNDSLMLEVGDNGNGMDCDLLNNVINPFVTTRTTRKIGLGIPLLKASAESSEGELKIYSQKGKGTKLNASFKIVHIDRPPLGDIAETITSVIAANPCIDFKLILNSIKGNFDFSTMEIKDKIGDVPISNYEVIEWIKEYIQEGITNIFGGVLNEITG